MKSTLVAGATGYLGRHLVTELRHQGYWVRALVRRPDQAAALTDANEVFVGQVTQPATLSGITDNVDTVFSTIGITRQRGPYTYDQVDYGGNLALLREAEQAGVRRFVYVSVLNGQTMRTTVELVKAKEHFVDALTASPLASTIIRPTGFFSDLRAILDMAGRGRVFLIGDGTRRVNPVSGHDLAMTCVEAAASACDEITVGGPEVFTHEQIAQLAAGIVGRACRITHLPPGLLKAALGLRALMPRRISGQLEFFNAVMTADMVAPGTGADRLEDFFREQRQCPGG